MIAYCARSGRKQTIELVEQAGWRWLVSPKDMRPSVKNYALDNGAWTAFTKQTIPGYVPPLGVSKSIDSAQAIEGQGELLNTGAQAIANMKGIF
jgi:hypothetical protein